ncbi:MarR family transcriptional regulator [Sphingomonas sp. 2R-10]|uniref:MarR family winged helix-turn-helix transcriptional regulator n=1 Tax=Sphingomonas sp. 2R-10 TaxID=3045148 RepID=UPI000F7BAA61|nr:MarR family transcriptional regulator [Sphingomonas sp. 2R-10]MDJ0276443.1 MarR family transcriptional regulator [Sphingomonas sp. 2R-10]
MAYGGTGKDGTGRRPRFVYLLTLAQRRVQAAIQGDVDGSTAARAGLLMALPPTGDGVPMKRLGTSLGLGAPALSGLLDRMARDGLVERRPDPADGRAWNITLTDAGRALRIEAARSAKLLNDRLCEGFDDAELTIVARWLEAAGTRFSREK